MADEVEPTSSSPSALIKQKLAREVRTNLCVEERHLEISLGFRRVQEIENVFIGNRYIVNISSW